jgi:hypothetical protein
MKIAVILPLSISSSAFSAKVAPLIEEQMTNPDAHFLCSTKPNFTATYLSSRKFRRCTLYIEEFTLVIKSQSIDYERIYVPRLQVDISLEHDCKCIIGYSLETNEAYIKKKE